MSESIYPPASQDLARKRRELAPAIQSAFDAFKGHTRAAMKHGASPQEIVEAIWVVAEMRAGGAYAHSAISLTTMNEDQEQHER